jgi:hypothetical protein
LKYFHLNLIRLILHYLLIVFFLSISHISVDPIIFKFNKNL